MKILQVTPCFYPAWAYGGPVPVVYYLSRELVKRGHDITVYATDALDKNNRQKSNYVELDGIKIFYFKNINNNLAWKRYFFSLGMFFHLKKEITSFDVIHVHGFRDFPTLLVHHYAIKNKIPYILQPHGSIETYFQKGFLKKFFDKMRGYRILKEAKKIIALTNTEAEQCKKVGIVQDNINIIPNGIDMSEFKDLPQKGLFRKKIDLNNDQRVVLYLGRIHKAKGVDLLVKAFSDLLNEIPNIKLVIAGPDDGYLHVIKEIVNELKIWQGVIFTGPLYSKDKLEAYVDSDVYVLPSYYETFPVSILEASACGVPVITTNNCGIADIVKDQLGFVVSCNMEELKNAIVYLLSNNQTRIEFGRKGRKLIFEKFTWPKIAEQVEKVYMRSLRRS